MSKNLKLMGLASYTGVATKKEGEDAVVIKRGEIACFPDDIAERIMEGGRTNADGDWVGYWQAAPDDATPNHNFTPEKLRVKKLTEEERLLVVAAAVKKPQRVARRTRS